MITQFLNTDSQNDEWDEKQYALDGYNQLQIIRNNKLQIIRNNQLQIIHQQAKKKNTDFDQTQIIDNQKDQNFQEEFQKMTDNQNIQKNQQLKKQVVQQDRKQVSITQISESNIGQDILPQEIKQNNKSEFQKIGDKKLLLSIKGENFSGFRIHSISFVLKCPSCKELILSTGQNIEHNTFQFQAQCKKCQKTMKIEYLKYVQQENPFKWVIGYVKTYEKIEWQLQIIQAKPICKCLSQSSRLPFLQLSFDNIKKNQEQIQRQKCFLKDQSRLLCHGCVQELQFQPDWLFMF